VNEDGLIISEENSIEEVRMWLNEHTGFNADYFVIVNNEGVYRGVVSSSYLADHHNGMDSVSTLIRRKDVWLKSSDTLKTAVELLVSEDFDFLPVLNENLVVTGVISYKDILNAYKVSLAKHAKAQPAISLKRQTLKLLLKGQRLIPISRNR
jgi:predicted transcriptional regulator